MFADMVGYSRRLEQDEEQNSNRVARSIELFKVLIGDYGGQVANVSGDSILALFESADQALRFALQMQTEFRDQAVWDDGDPIEFRIGLGFGDVRVDAGNIQGHCVNVAARLQALADPGSIYLTAVVRDALRDRSRLSFRSLGPQSLKNISEPIEVFSVTQLRSEIALEADKAKTKPAPPMAPSRYPSVAVLAFANLSDDAATDHLCRGLAADVIANLSRFRSLMVIARHSAFLFSLNSNTAREVGRRLGARYILGGRLNRAGKLMRIAVELIDVESEGVLWSDHFNTEMDALFHVQDEITGAVASRLATQINFAEWRRGLKQPLDMRAYGLVLRGQQLILRFTKEANAHARRLFEEAIEIAPDFGRAYSALSRTHNLDWRYSWSRNPSASLDAAVSFARQAIERDRLDASGFAELGFARLYKKEHDEALAEYGRAMTLNPNDSDIIAEYADCLVYVGQPSKSIELLERAMQLNPYFPDWYLWYLADAYNALGRPNDVIATVRRMHNPDEGRRLLAANFAHLGMMEEAREQAEAVMRLHPEFTIGRWGHRPPYRDKSILERYIEGLRKAGLPE